jgi:hypothetical protein
VATNKSVHDLDMFRLDKTLWSATDTWLSKWDNIDTFGEGGSSASLGGMNIEKVHHSFLPYL